MLLLTKNIYPKSKQKIEPKGKAKEPKRELWKNGKAETKYSSTKPLGLFAWEKLYQKGCVEFFGQEKLREDSSHESTEMGLDEPPTVSLCGASRLEASRDGSISIFPSTKPEASRY